jgi:protein CpxP
MSLKTKLFTGVTAVFAAGAFAVAGSAQTTETPKADGTKAEKLERKGYKRGGEGKGMHGGKMGRMGGGMHGLRGIELTEDQKTAIKAIREANKPDPSIREEMKTIMQARRAGTITEDQKLRAQALREQMKQRAEGIQLQIQNVLTPEQRQQIETNKLEREKRMQERREQRQLRRQGAQKTEG